MGRQRAQHVDALEGEPGSFREGVGRHLRYVQFDDSKIATVDIFVSKAAVKFTKAGDPTVVNRDVTFRP